MLLRCFVIIKRNWKVKNLEAEAHKAMLIALSPQCFRRFFIFIIEDS